MHARKGIGRRAALTAGLGLLAACAPVPRPRESKPQGDQARPGGVRPGALDAELLAAAEAGEAAAVAALLDQGADVEARDDEGRSPLMLAALGDRVEVARALVDTNADPDAPDDLGDTPWVTCGVTGSVAMMRVLLPAGPDLAIPNRRGGSPLHPAAERGHVDYVREVLAATDIATEIDRVNFNGWTALLEAVALGDGGEPHQEIVAELLGAGADPDIGDRNGHTALQHARERGYQVIEDLLS